MTALLLLIRKDLRALVRSPLLLGALLAYPLVIALLVGLVATYANAKPRVALVDEDDLPAVVEIAGHRFDVDATIRRVSRNVELVRLPAGDARRRLASGDVVAVVTVPDGFVANVRAMVNSPALELETGRGGLAPIVTQQMQALVYTLNRELQTAYIDANLEYVELLLHGGSGTFLGRRFDVLGLSRTEQALSELQPEERVEPIRDFVRVTRLALEDTDEALRTTANPIELRTVERRGRGWALSEHVQAAALALVLALVALLLGAALLAAERDERTLARLVRGPAGLGRVVVAKVLVAAVVAVLVGVALAVAFGVAIEATDVPGGQPWARVPLLAAGLALAGAAFGALGALLGALARDSRTAALVAVLVVLPIVFLGLVPEEVVPAAATVSDAVPFAHATRFFESALFDARPWETLAREALWLGALTLGFGAAARVAARRLLT